MISCEKHDYIEIACMFNFPIELSMKSGDIINGVAIDVQRNDKKEECIKLKTEEKFSLVVLSEIAIIKACIDNPHFTELTLS